MSDIVCDLIHMVSTPKRDGALYFLADLVAKPENRMALRIVSTVDTVLKNF